jgi:hypothetical protein
MPDRKTETFPPVALNVKAWSRELRGKYLGLKYSQVAFCDSEADLNFLLYGVPKTLCGYFLYVIEMPMPHEGKC